MNAAAFVIALAQMGTGVRQGPVPALEAPEAWPTVVDLAIQHRVAPLVWQALSHAPAGTVPQPILAEFEAQMWRSSATRMVCEHTLQLLLETLAAQGIDVLVLKGPTVAHAFYPRPELRFYHDLDLLCRPVGYPRLRHALLATGYTSGYTSDASHETLTHKLSPIESHAVRNFFDPSGNVEIEVHFDVLQFGLVERHHEMFWREARTLAAGALEMRVLAPVHQLLHLAAHAHRHGYNRLSWLIDLDLLVRQQKDQIDWAHAMRLARDEGMGTVLAYTLAIAHEVLGTPLPPLPRPTAEEYLLRGCYRLLWPRARVQRLEREEHPRLVRFWPGRGVLLDVAYGLVFLGRRREKWSITRRYGWRRAGL